MRKSELLHAGAIKAGLVIALTIGVGATMASAEDTTDEIAVVVDAFDPSMDQDWSDDADWSEDASGDGEADDVGFTIEVLESDGSTMDDVDPDQILYTTGAAPAELGGGADDVKRGDGATVPQGAIAVLGQGQSGDGGAGCARPVTPGALPVCD